MATKRALVQIHPEAKPYNPQTNEPITEPVVATLYEAWNKELRILFKQNRHIESDEWNIFIPSDFFTIIMSKPLQ